MAGFGLEEFGSDFSVFCPLHLAIRRGGNDTMSRAFGLDKLVEQVLEDIEGEIRSRADDETVGETPIERVLFLALWASICYCKRCEFGELGGPCVINRVKTRPREYFFTDPIYRLELLVETQALVGDWRVDFLLHRRNLRLSDERWESLIVECDGHDFHERTKEQAAKDRSRDRLVQSQGYEIFRFTGSEIWRDPLGCAEQICDWASKGWG